MKSHYTTMAPQSFRESLLMQLERDVDASLTSMYQDEAAVAVEEPEDAVVVVDPISTGAMVALLSQREGYKVVAVYSEGLTSEVLSLIPKPCKDAGLKFDHIVKVRIGERDGISLRGPRRVVEVSRC